MEDNNYILLSYKNIIPDKDLSSIARRCMQQSRVNLAKRALVANDKARKFACIIEDFSATGVYALRSYANNSERKKKEGSSVLVDDWTNTFVVVNMHGMLFRVLCSIR